MTSIIHQIIGWNCPTHGGFSNLNRWAWPDCLHGVAGSTVKALDPVLKGEREFSRLSWIGPESSSFHDWQTVKPSWLSLPRAYSYFETKILSANSTRRMSHYTSVDGALAIIQSNRIRFTDYRYLNDKRELTYAVDLWPAAGFTDTELRCFDGTGNFRWKEGSILASSSLRR
jgi:hypothetical protein